MPCTPSLLVLQAKTAATCLAGVIPRLDTRGPTYNKVVNGKKVSQHLQTSEFVPQCFSMLVKQLQNGHNPESCD